MWKEKRLISERLSVKLVFRSQWTGSHYLPSKSALAPKQQQLNNNDNFIHNPMAPTVTRPQRAVVSVIHAHRVEGRAPGGGRITGWRRTSDRNQFLLWRTLEAHRFGKVRWSHCSCAVETNQSAAWKKRDPSECVSVCVSVCVCVCVCVCAHVDEERVGLLREQERAQLPLSPQLVNSVGGLPLPLLPLLPLQSHLVSPPSSHSSSWSPGTLTARRHDPAHTHTHTAAAWKPHTLRERPR